MKVQYRERDLIRPRRPLLQPDAVSTPPEQVPGSDEAAFPGRLKLESGAVPDESVEFAERKSFLGVMDRWIFIESLFKVSIIEPLLILRESSLELHVVKGGSERKISAHFTGG